MKRTPLTRRTPLRSTGGLSRGNGPKRRRTGVDRTLYESVLARDGGCVARGMVVAVVCYGRIDPHHVLMRSQGGKDTADNLISVCRAHHDWIHANPAKSYAMDLLRHPNRSTTRPEED